MNWTQELTSNALAYKGYPWYRRELMATRALYFASLTIHRQWIHSYTMWEQRRQPGLPAAVKFLETRKGLRPHQWVGVNKRHSAKSQFARALLGYSDAPCYDILMKRSGIVVGSTREQWALWFQLYKERWPKTSIREIIEQHCKVLQWVRG